MSGFVTTSELEKTLKNIDNKFDQHKLIVTQRKWRAYLSTSQLNITDNTWTKIQFDGLTYDCDGVGLSSYGYPVSESGIYLGILNFTLAGTSVVADKTWGARFYVNAVGRPLSYIHSSWISALTCQVIDEIRANVGDIIYGYAWHNAGVNTPDIWGNEWGTYMTIHLKSRLCK